MFQRQENFYVDIIDECYQNGANVFFLSEYFPSPFHARAFIQIHSQTQSNEMF